MNFIHIHMNTYVLLVCFFVLNCGAQPGQTETSQEINVPNIKGKALPTDVTCTQVPNEKYEDFPSEFFLNYCRDCHSSYWTGEERYGAPVLINFDTYRQVMIYRSKILQQLRVSPAAMPPGRDIDNDDFKRILLWLQCGAPE